MNLIKRKCPICGGTLEVKGKLYFCSSCMNSFDLNNEPTDSDKVIAYLNDEKLEMLSNARYALYEAAHEKHLSKEKIKSCVSDVKKIYPDDFLSSFYEALINPKRDVLNKFLSKINLKKYSDFKDEIIKSTIRSLEYDNVIALKDFVERSCVSPLKNEYNTEIEKVASKISDGIYNLDIDRDFFICYSSKDMDDVIDITKLLESNGLTCFVALRNLRHGVGSLENYKESIEKAMRNSKAILFLSSHSSRDMTCDALRFELPYLKNNLNEKPRVEFLIDNYSSKVTPIIKKFLKEIFDEYNTVSNKNELIKACSDIVFKAKEKEENVIESGVKFCAECGLEVKSDVSECPNCLSNHFEMDSFGLLRYQKEKCDIELKSLDDDFLKNEKRLDKENTNNVFKASKTLKNEYEKILLECEKVKEKITNEDEKRKALIEKHNKVIGSKLNKIVVNVSNDIESERNKTDAAFKKSFERMLKDKAKIFEELAKQSEIEKNKKLEEIRRAEDRHEYFLKNEEKIRSINSSFVTFDENEKDTLYFGRYPQTVIGKKESKAFKKIKPNSSWKKFKNYDDIYYFDIDTNDDGLYDYRGVVIMGDLRKFQKKCGIKKKKIMWFKYEPIKWRILDRIDAKYLLIMDSVIDGCYNSFSNEYKYDNTSVKKWINEEFIKTSFNSEELTLISDFQISDSSETANEKFYPLSRDEAYKYESNLCNIDPNITDYSVMRYAENDGKIEWWLREVKDRALYVAIENENNSLFTNDRYDLSYICEDYYHYCGVRLATRLEFKW